MYHQNNNKYLQACIIIGAFLLIALSVFFVELLIAQLLPSLTGVYASLDKSWLNALILSLSITPIIYLIIRRNSSVNQSNINNKLLLASGVPLLISLALMFNIVTEKEKEIESLSLTKTYIELDIQFDEMIVESAKEMELTVLSLIDKKYKKDLPAIRASVDRFLNKLKMTMKDLEIKSDRGLGAELPAFRNKIDNGDFTWEEALKFYLQRKVETINRMTLFIDRIDDKEIQKVHEHYETLLKIKQINAFISMMIKVTYEGEKLNLVNATSYKQMIPSLINEERLYSNNLKTTTDEKWRLSLVEAFSDGSIEIVSTIQDAILERKKETFNLLEEKTQKQVERTRTDESSPKNTTLYFGILLETKHLLKAIMSLLEEYYKAHDTSVKPAKATNKTN